jgi:hypothetical protein
MQGNALVYENSTMRCEGVFGNCSSSVARVYHPFCHRCFVPALRRGSFKSRDGLSYRYDGRRWIEHEDMGASLDS